MMQSEMMNMITESVDMKNLDTFRLVVSLNEAEQKNATIILANKLYKMIVNKLDDMDFHEIEKTKGDITKLKQYNQTKDCIATLMMIAQENKTGVEEVKTIEQALFNVETLKPIFRSGFVTDTSIIKYFYDTIVMAIITDIGFMTTVCVEFIKNPDSTVSMEIGNLKQYKTKFSLIHKSLENFNTAAEKGQIEKAFKPLITAKSKQEAVQLEDIDILTEDNGIASTLYSAGSLLLLGAASILAMIILPIMRPLTYIFFAFKAHLSDWFALQAYLLKMNSYRIKTTTQNLNESEKKKILKEQEKWSDRMSKISNRLAVNYVAAEKNAVVDSAKDSKTVINKTEIDHPTDVDVDSYVINQVSLF